MTQQNTAASESAARHRGLALSSVSLQPENRQPIYLLTGPFAEFRGLTHKHHTAMARELAREEPELLHSLLDDYHLGNAE